MALLGLVIAAAGVTGRSSRDEFALGTEAYVRARDASDPDEERKLLEEARGHFESILRSGLRNGYVYYNLGNTQFKLGELGRALASYRRAERFIPDYPELKANLELARSKREDELPLKRPNPALRAIFFWHYALGVRAMEKVATMMWALGFATLAVALFRHRARWAGALLIALSLLAAASNWVKLRAESAREGVVTSAVADVWSEPSGSSEKRFSLHEGAELKILREAEAGRWLLVTAGKDLRGWMEARHLEELFPEVLPPEDEPPSPPLPSPEVSKRRRGAPTA